MSSSQPPEATGGPLGRGFAQFLPHTLTAKLIVTTILLVAVLGAVVATVTTVALRDSLLARLDDQLISASLRRSAPPDDGKGPSLPPQPCVVPPVGTRLEPREFTQTPGTVLGKLFAGCRVVAVVDDTGYPEVLPTSDAAAVNRAGAEKPQTVSLSIGQYRVLESSDNPSRLVTGLPMADVTDTVHNVVLREIAVTIGGVALAGVIGQALVRRQLTPLKRVAATATAVTRLPLSSGEVGVIERVPSELTDPSTEVGQVGAALNSMLGHVEQALDTRQESEQRVRQFLADASHELRTPLSTIMGYAELTRRTADDPGAMTHAMSRIQAESGRMTELVNDLLLLARLDSGRPLEHGDVDVSRLLVEAVNDARVLSQDHVWRIELPPEPLHVEGDHDRLHQVVSNLLTNAIRHTPPGTVVSVSAASVLREGDRPHGVLVTVHDDGPGMPESMAGKEFERFTRGDTSRTRTSGGAGLGLSIVAAIVAAHAGSVRISSEPGDTTLEVRLPARWESGFTLRPRVET